MQSIGKAANKLYSYSHQLVLRSFQQLPSADRVSMLAEGIKKLYGEHFSLLFGLMVYSDGFYSTITYLREGKDYRLQPNVLRLLCSYEDG